MVVLAYWGHLESCVHHHVLSLTIHASDGYDTH